MRFQAQILLLLYAFDKLFEQFQGFLAVFFFELFIRINSLSVMVTIEIFPPWEAPGLSILD